MLIREIQTEWRAEYGPKKIVELNLFGGFPFFF
jgi:hypothetical protein